MFVASTFLIVQQTWCPIQESYQYRVVWRISKPIDLREAMPLAGATMELWVSVANQLKSPRVDSSRTCSTFL